MTINETTSVLIMIEKPFFFRQEILIGIYGKTKSLKVKEANARQVSFITNDIFNLSTLTPLKQIRFQKELQYIFKMKSKRRNSP